MKDVDLPFKTIEELRDIAYSAVDESERVRFTDKAVGIIRSWDETIMDAVWQVKKFEFVEEWVCGRMGLRKNEFAETQLQKQQMKMV